MLKMDTPPQLVKLVKLLEIILSQLLSFERRLCGIYLEKDGFKFEKV